MSTRHYNNICSWVKSWATIGRDESLICIWLAGYPVELKAHKPDGRLIFSSVPENDHCIQYLYSAILKLYNFKIEYYSFVVSLQKTRTTKLVWLCLYNFFYVSSDCNNYCRLWSERYSRSLLCGYWKVQLKYSSSYLCRQVIFLTCNSQLEVTIIKGIL